jgi:hypothetical protein
VYCLGASGSATVLAGNMNARILRSTCVENFLVGCWLVQVDLRGVSETFFTHLDCIGRFARCFLNTGKDRSMKDNKLSTRNHN